jgi:hypothetical protein
VFSFIPLSHRAIHQGATMPSQRLGSLIGDSSDSGSDSEWEDMVEGPVVITSLMSGKMATRPGSPGRSLRPSAERCELTQMASVPPLTRTVLHLTAADSAVIGGYV